MAGCRPTIYLGGSARFPTSMPGSAASACRQVRHAVGRDPRFAVADVSEYCTSTVRLHKNWGGVPIDPQCGRWLTHAPAVDGGRRAQGGGAGRCRSVRSVRCGFRARGCRWGRCPAPGTRTTFAAAPSVAPFLTVTRASPVQRAWGHLCALRMHGAGQVCVLLTTSSRGAPSVAGGAGVGTATNIGLRGLGGTERVCQLATDLHTKTKVQRQRYVSGVRRAGLGPVDQGPRRADAKRLILRKPGLIAAPRPGRVVSSRRPQPPRA